MGCKRAAKAGHYDIDKCHSTLTMSQTGASPRRPVSLRLPRAVGGRRTGLKNIAGEGGGWHSWAMRSVGGEMAPLREGYGRGRPRDMCLPSLSFRQLSPPMPSIAKAPREASTALRDALPSPLLGAAPAPPPRGRTPRQRQARLADPPLLAPLLDAVAVAVAVAIPV